MQPVLVVRDDRFTQHLEGLPHLESPKRLAAVCSALEDPSLRGRWALVPPRPATEEELAWIHTPAHIRAVAQSAGKPLTAFDLDTQTTACSYEVARLAAGGVFCLLDSVWRGPARRGFAFVRPPGHHAEPDRAMGFCLFNNVALGARYLQERCHAERILIVDIDLHHGNGIQKAFYETDEVLYVSTHQFPSYPGTGGFGEVGRGRGEGFSVNIPLSGGHRGRDFARILHALVDPLARAYRPQMVLVACGFDLYLHDPLGKMSVTPGGYAMMTRFLLDIADRVCDGRIAFVMEGGYSLRGIRECSLRVMQELCGISTLAREKIERILQSTPRQVPALKKVLEVHHKYWRIPGFGTG